jgi:hypothetical protein
MVPEFRIHSALTGDAATVERAIEEANAPRKSFMSRRAQLYKVARQAPDLFDNASRRTRAVLFVTFNREKPSHKQATQLLALYRQQAIRLDVIVLPSDGDRRSAVRGATAPLGGVFCDPGPGCPPLGKGTQPDLGTLDRVAAGTGGRIWRIRANERIDWKRLIDEIEGRGATISNSRP